jgi:hypothetical protein
MIGWYPWGEHLEDDADFSIDDWTRWHRITERDVEIIKAEIAKFHIMLWYQEDDRNSAECYVEMCAFGSNGGYASKIPLHTFLDQSMDEHKYRSRSEGAAEELLALKDLRRRLDAMIDEREIAKQRVAPNLRESPKT